MTISSSQKMKNVKYRFWLQRGIKSHIRHSFFMSHPHVVGWFHLLFLAHNHFIKSKIGNRKIPFLVTKRSQKSYPICFSDPRPRNYAWFHLLFLTHDNFIKPETQKRKIPFLVTKRNQKLNLINFSDLRHPNCQWFHSLLFTNLTESKNLIFLRIYFFITQSCGKRKKKRSKIETLKFENHHICTKSKKTKHFP